MTAKMYEVGDLARELGVSNDRVIYLLKTRKHIRPVGKLGPNRYFDARALRQLAKELSNDRRKTAS